MRLRFAAVTAAALSCLFAMPAASGEWRRDQQGVCHEVWTRRDLVRGPIAIANGVLRPVTSLVGGVWFAVAQCHHRARCFVVGPLWVVGSTSFGLGEGLYWAATGVLDTLTLGTGPLSPYEASRLQLVPVVPFVRSHPLSVDEHCEP